MAACRGSRFCSTGHPSITCDPSLLNPICHSGPLLWTVRRELQLFPIPLHHGHDSRPPPFFPTSRIVACLFAAWWPMSPWWSIVSAHRIPIPHLCRTIWLTANLWLTSPIRIAQTSVSFSICTRSYATLIQSLVCKGRRSNSLSLEIGQPVQ